MAKIMSSLLAAALLALGISATPAQAQLARTYVSAASGSDTNDCGRATPCKTFQRAHNQTLTLGEITVLDPGGYGAVTITKGISIINDGVGEAGVLVSGGLTGITVNAPATDRVSLRGLTVKGIGFGGGNGIAFNSGASLTIENCAIRNLTRSSIEGYGITFVASGSSNLTVSNTLVADNDVFGIWIYAVSGASTAVLNRVEVYNNGSVGVEVDGGNAAPGTTVKVTVADSVLSNNKFFGVGSSRLSGAATTRVMVVRSVVANNGVGIFSNATFTQVGQSVVTANGATWQAQNGSLLQSFGDNYVANNADGNPAFPSFINRQ